VKSVYTCRGFSGKFGMEVIDGFEMLRNAV
jgi:hypothetical protein